MSTCYMLRIRDLHQYLEKMLPEITYCMKYLAQQWHKLTI
jgi:hypothetical protein